MRLRREKIIPAVWESVDHVGLREILAMSATEEEARSLLVSSTRRE